MPLDPPIPPAWKGSDDAPSERQTRRFLDAAHAAGLSVLWNVQADLLARTMAGMINVIPVVIIKIMIVSNKKQRIIMMNRIKW